MQFTLLGTGTCVPSLLRSSASTLIQTREACILFDIGAGTIRRLLEVYTPINRVTHLLLSHFHPDHTGELISFIFSSKYAKGFERTQKLHLIGGPGLIRFYEALTSAFCEYINLDETLFEITELNQQSGYDFSGPDFSISAAPVNHSTESVAFKITDSENKSIVLSGDTEFSEGLVDLANGCDYLICDCSVPDGVSAGKHMTPSVAGKTATLAQVSNLVLTHFYPECEKVDIAKQCRKTYDGRLFLGEDLKLFTL